VPWYFAVIEADHELQNPTSPEKIVQLGERLGLRAGSRVLDLASGKAGPALLLARTFGCRITCVERAAEFHEAARRRVAGAGLDGLIELVQADAADYAAEPEAYDAALCLGASFVWGDLDRTLAALAPAVRPGGAVAVGEPYWRRWPPPAVVEPGPGEDWRTLAGTVDRFRESGLAPIALIASSEDDWDLYESLHWLAGERWLAEHPDDADAPTIRERLDSNRHAYLDRERELLGWAIVAARKPF
jgi:SAM-dependent methyltransferase